MEAALRREIPERWSEQRAVVWVCRIEGLVSASCGHLLAPQLERGIPSGWKEAGPCCPCFCRRHPRKSRD